MFTEANPITLPSDPGFGRAPPLQSPMAAAARNIILGLGVALAASIAAVGSYVVSSSPAAPLNMSPAYRSLPNGTEVQPEFVCNLVALECVMNNYVAPTAAEFTAMLVAHPFPSPPPLPERVPVDPVLPALDSLTEAQMLALMQMSCHTRNQAVYHDMRGQHSAPLFFLSDIIGLREQGLATKPANRSFHMLTDAGEMLGTAVADYLVKTHRIHASWIGGGAGPTTSLHCTCGWKCGLRKGDRMQRKASLAMQGHLRTVAAVNDLATALAPLNVT